MRDIFAELYNKVVSFFNQAENKETENAKDVACNRLKLVLMQDRTNLTPMIMDRMRKELVELLSKYLELDKELLDLNFEQEDNQMALMLSIPVIRAKNEDEILAILEEEDKKKESEEEIEDDEDSDDIDDESDEDEEDTDEEESEDESDEEKEEVNETSESDAEEKEESEEEIIIVKKDDEEPENSENNEENNISDDASEELQQEKKKKDKVKK